MIPRNTLLGEVDVAPDQYDDYFGNSNRRHMLLNFYLNNYLFLSLARNEAKPLAKAFQQLHKYTEGNQLANFIRNHDELDLERLTDEEREEVYAAFAPEENMRIYDRGIRRRLAPMLENNRKKIELAYSMMFTLPGTPVLRYGQEIGMGEDLSLEERTSVHTLMQWSNQKNGGFSPVPANQLVRPIIAKGDFSYEHVNVNDQQRDPNSLLNWFKRVINARNNCPEFGWGSCKLLDTKNTAVLAQYCTQDNNIVLAIHNFGEQATDITLKHKSISFDNFIEVFSDNETYQPIDPSSKKIHLKGYGYRWFRSNNL